MKPLIKWVGSKRRLLPQLLPLLPPLAELAYVEPFLGSGALFFEAGHTAATCYLSDANYELINTYRMLRGNDQHKHVLTQLFALAQLHQKDSATLTYAKTRARFNDRLGSPTERAAMFLYLNRTCFNGVWRTNKKGEFNVPPGDYKNPAIYMPKLLQEGAALLRDQRTTITCTDYARTVHEALEEHRSNVFVYLDPPYVPLSETANFTGYTANGFGHEDFGRLRTLCKYIDRAGAQFMLSNSNTPVVHEAFKAFHCAEISRCGGINSNTKKRAAVAELVIRNYL